MNIWTYIVTTLIWLTIPSYGGRFGSQCDEVARIFRGEKQSKRCSCPNETSDLWYYGCKSPDNESCFSCLHSNVAIPGGAVCDNIIDCPDFTDEMVCSWQNMKNQSCSGNYVDITIDELHKYLSTKENTYYYKRGHACRYGRKGDRNVLKGKNATDLWMREGCPFLYCSTEASTCDCYSNFLVKKSLQDEYILFVSLGILIGILAITGNAAVIFTTVRNIYKRHTRLRREEKVTKYLFLSLSVSDMIVAICTVIISTQLLRDFDEFEQIDLGLSLCNVTGALILTGSEQSVSTMVLITMSRMWGILKPFSQIAVKPLMIILLLSWVLTIIIPLFPLMEAFEDDFAKALIQDDIEPFKKVVVHDHYFTDVINLLQPYFNGSMNIPEFRDFIRKKFNQTFDVIGYYRSGYSCAPDMFQRNGAATITYNVAIYVYNFLCFLFMAAGYILIYIKQRHHKKIQARNAAERESQKLKRKIFFILATDFICWVPICVFGIVHTILIYVKDKEYCLSGHTSRTLTFSAVLVVMPINSALNPFIYSAAPEYLHRKIVAFFQLLRSKCNRGIDRSGHNSKEQDNALPASQMDGTVVATSNVETTC